MSTLTREQVLSTIATVPTPKEILGSASDLVSAGMISGLVVQDGNVGFAIEIKAIHAQPMERVRKAIETELLSLTGVKNVTAVLTADASNSTTATTASKEAAPKATPPTSGKRELTGVKHIVAVASGKGGVGKSTTSVNVAAALASQGLKVGILDADIYGPSLPRALGLSGKKPHSPDGKTIIPLEAFGLKVMSIGFMVGEETPMIWRGPMVQSALQQMIYNAAWGELDVLVVDMPPGTGDAQLTMAQNVPLSGAVIVSTPQDLALLDARKGINMFLKVNVPILGLIENMSQFTCPSCGETSNIFGHDGARKEAAKLKVPFLGALPLVMDIREKTDAGTPVVSCLPDSPAAKAYQNIAKVLWDGLENANQRPAAPSISMN
ncbi:MAG: iron-sulfur cluster carrier protein ApbC [Alphaproteobacteria bacterium]